MIVVNRQRALANAFEDLVHERRPRAGASLRRAYDAVGLSVSRQLRARYPADAIYVLTKPAEWCSYVALLLADGGDPEERVERMCRPGGVSQPKARRRSSSTPSCGCSGR